MVLRTLPYGYESGSMKGKEPVADETPHRFSYEDESKDHKFVPHSERPARALIHAKQASCEWMYPPSL
jgi:hypothetical protein